MVGKDNANARYHEEIEKSEDDVEELDCFKTATAFVERDGEATFSRFKEEEYEDNLLLVGRFLVITLNYRFIMDERRGSEDSKEGIHTIERSLEEGRPKNVGI